MRKQIFGCLRVAGAVLFCLVLPPLSFLCGAAGFNLLACQGTDDKFGWAIFETIALPLAWPETVLPVWGCISAGILAGIFTLRLGLKRAALLGLIALLVLFIGGLAVAGATGASESCVLRLF